MRSLLRYKNSSALLGVDIASTAVNIIELSHRQNHFCVEGYGHALLPVHAVDNGSICDLDAVVHAMRQALIDVNSLSKHAVLAVPNAFVMSKVIQMSASLSDIDMEAWVRLNVEKHISCPLKDIYFDFDIQGVSAQNPGLLDVLIVASRAEHVNQRVEAVRRAGLLSHIVEVESHAFQRAVLSFTKNQTSQILFIADIGIHTANYMVFDGAKIIFSREEALNGLQLVQAVVGVLDVFLMQLMRAWQFATSITLNSAIEQIILVGPVGDLSGLTSWVQEQMNKPCCIANPFSHMTLSSQVNRDQLQSDASCLMTACGLAMRETA